MCYVCSECSECPAGTEPVVGFEYKWWNRMPSNMRSSVFSVEYSSTDRTTGKYHFVLLIADTSTTSVTIICLSLTLKGSFTPKEIGQQKVLGYLFEFS